MCVKGKVRSWFNPAQAGVNVLYTAHHSQLYIMCTCLVFPGPWWGLRGLRGWRGEVGGANLFSPEKNEMRVIGLKRVWFKLRRLGSEFSALGHSHPTATGLLIPEQQLRNSHHAGRPERILENDFQ